MHRVVNRLGLVHTTSREDTADDLNKATPERFKFNGYEWLIQNGMEICKA